MDFLKRYSLSFAVFFTGAFVLVIEVVAVRILSPYYGNTIFTVSSVIGIVLGALSVGYYAGGKLADRYPVAELFYLIIVTAGISLLFVQFGNVFLLPILSTALTLRSGPLVSSLMLFFFPSFLLALLSPFAIKLQKVYTPREGLGTVTGKIFFWSTLGSISGSLITGFVLIPRLGINQIIVGTAFALIAIGSLALLIFSLQRGRVGRAMIFVLLLIGILIASSVFFGEAQKDSEIIYTSDGVYEKIMVYDGKYHEKATRFLQQDRSASGAMFLNSDELAYDYTKYYALYKIFNQAPKNALFIGGGAYSMPKALFNESPDTTIDVAEIEPSLFILAKQYFNLSDDARIRNHVEDGRRFLKLVPKSYDVIFSDVYYSLISVPAHFTTREFFETAYEKLSPDGVFIANFIGNLSRQQPSLIFSAIKTFQEVFPNAYFFAADSPGSLQTQNIIFFAYKGDRKIDFQSALIKQNDDLLIRSLGGKLIDLERFDLSAYPILTDNYAPIEYLTASVLSKSLTGQDDILDGDEMLALIDHQLRYGPRFIGSSGHKRIQTFLLSELDTLADQVVTQRWKVTSEQKELDLMNIVARFHPEQKKRIILGTHYDSKKYANLDVERPDLPVPGANDSASGVSVLIEIARVLANNERNTGIGVDIVFFDGEEGLPDNDADWYPLGSTYFSEHLPELYVFQKPLGAVIIDMVCDKNLRFMQERSSLEYTPNEVKRFWDVGKTIDQAAFPSLTGLEIHDDHTPLNLVGIPSFLIIDLDYPSFHTRHDTLDQCSSKSLETVAQALLHYLEAI